MRPRIVAIDGNRERLSALEPAFLAAGWSLIRAHDRDSLIQALRAGPARALLIGAGPAIPSSRELALLVERHAPDLPVLRIGRTHGLDSSFDAEQVAGEVRELLRATSPSGPGAPRPLEADVARVETATVEAAQAAFEESFERADQIFRAARQVEVAKEAYTQAASGRNLTRELEWLASLLARAPALAGTFVATEAERPRLGEADERFLAALTHGADIEAARARAGLGEARAQAVALLGLEGGWLRPGEAARAPAPLADGQGENKDARWRRFCEAALEQDYFQILGVDRDATTEQVRAAVGVRRKQLDLGASPEALPAFGQKAWKMLEDAARILGHPQARAAYRRHAR